MLHPCLVALETAEADLSQSEPRRVLAIKSKRKLSDEAARRQEGEGFRRDKTSADFALAIASTGCVKFDILELILENKRLSTTM